MEVNIAELWGTYSQNILDAGRKVIIAMLIIIGGKIIISFAKTLTQKAVTGKLKADETLVSILWMLIHYGIIGICFIMILDLFGVNTTGLIALLGGAVVAVGFALKDTLGNIASGIVILFLRPFKKGDFIECGSVMGFVREMGLFATIMETPDGIYISAPNSSLWGVPLKNYSRNEKRRIDIAIPIAYSNSIDDTFRVLNNIIMEEERFLKDPPAQVMVQSLGDSGIGITLRAWVPGAMYWVVYWDQMKNIKEKLQEAGITIAFPKRDIRLVKDDRNQPDEKSRDNKVGGANEVGDVSGG